MNSLLCPSGHRLHAAVAATVIAILALTGSPATAQTVRTWSVTSGTWNDTNSWLGGPPLASEIAFFSDAGLYGSDVTALLSADTAVLGLSFGNNRASTTIAGNGASRTLTLGTSGITVAIGAGPITVGLTGSATSLILNGTQTFTNDNPFPPLTLNSMNTAGSIGSDLTVTGPGFTICQGSISDAAGRVISIRKDGTGTLILSGFNTFTGGVTLVGGMLVLQHDRALGDSTGTFTIGSSTSSVTIDANGRFIINNNPQAWNGDFTYRGTNTLNLGAGTVTLSGNRTVTVNASTLFVGGTIGDGGSGYSLTKSGSGTLRLNAANTYTGPTIISGGTLALGASGALASGTISVSSGGTLDVSAKSGFSLSSGQTLGGRGTLVGATTFGNGSRLTFDATGPLVAQNTLTFTSFGISSLAGVNWDSLAIDSPYTLIDGIQNFSAASLLNFGEGNQADVGTNRKAYFQAGGLGGTDLQLVVVPEPTTYFMALAGIACGGFSMWRRRKRA